LLGSLAGEREGFDFLLRKHFPAFRLDRNSLEKWWAVQVAVLAQPSVFDTLSPRQTEEALAAALVLRVPVTAPSGDATEAQAKPRKPSPLAALFRFGRGRGGSTGNGAGAGDEGDAGGEAGPEAGQPGGEAATPANPSEPAGGTAGPGTAAPGAATESVPLEEFKQVVGRPDRAAVVRPNQMALGALQQRAFPLQRPVIDGYLDALKRIAEGKPDGVDAALAALAERRRVLLADASDAEDYLDWFEATQLSEKCGAFDGFLDAAESMRDLRPRRDDPVSEYLDAVSEVVD
jgi:hypothetical protein